MVTVMITPCETANICDKSAHTVTSIYWNYILSFRDWHHWMIALSGHFHLPLGCHISKLEGYLCSSLCGFGTCCCRMYFCCCTRCNDVLKFVVETLPCGPRLTIQIPCCSEVLSQNQIPGWQKDLIPARLIWFFPFCSQVLRTPSNICEVFNRQPLEHHKHYCWYILFHSLFENFI